jgi:two-component system, NarL family, nitrate/nitrite response regulator NarL
LEPPTPDPVAPARAEPRTETLRVLAVEDHPVMRIGIRALLEREGMTVVGLSATSAEAVEQARQGLADVALVDLNLPDAEGVDVIERLHDAAPQLPVIAYSIDGSADRVRAAVRAGAIGYLTKGTPAKRVIAALRAAAAGLSALGPEEAAALAEPHDAVTLVQKAVARSLPNGFEHPPSAPIVTQAAAPVDRSPKDALSARELELLKYLAEGYTNKEIARAMVLAEDTVKKAVQTLIAKLGATDRTHAVVIALRSDLIQ